MTAKADHKMTAEELKAKYDALQPDGWSQHPVFPHEDWQREVSELNTLRGYWDWVASQIEQRHDEEQGRSEVKDPAVKVRQVGGPEGETQWLISQNLTDRWGDINYHNAANKPLAELEENKDLLERLRSQMVGEETFIVRKDGKYGILFEMEFLSIESEDDESLKPHDEVVEALLRGMQKIAENFPGIELAVPDKAEIVNERPAAWAFVADGLLADDQRKAFIDAWYGLFSL